MMTVKNWSPIVIKKIAKERSYTNDGDARDVGLHKGNLLCHRKEKTLETLENLP